MIFDHSFATEPTEFLSKVQPKPQLCVKLQIINHDLFAQLGIPETSKQQNSLFEGSFAKNSQFSQQAVIQNMGRINSRTDAHRLLL